MEKEKDQPLLQINLLGNPKVSFGDSPPLQLPKKVLALLFNLAIEQQMVPRSKLVLLFWSDVPDELARRSLRTGLSELRKVLGSYIKSTRQEIGLDWQIPLLVNALELETCLNNKL